METNSSAKWHHDQNAGDYSLIADGECIAVVRRNEHCGDWDVYALGGRIGNRRTLNEARAWAKSVAKSERARKGQP